MQKRQSFLPFFFLFLLVSLLAVFLSIHNILFGHSFFENMLFPLQAVIFKTATLPATFFKDTKLEIVQKENISLTNQLVDLNKLQQDNKALHDQFEITDIPSMTLLPADVIGDSQFFPGVSLPEALVLNKGKKEGVKIGQAVIYRKNILGLITKITDHASEVTLVSNTASSFTATTSLTHAQGVLKGQGNGVMVLGNVVLADQLRGGDIVVTSGSEDVSGKGFPPGLVVGKIISVDKNPSNLYQSASVKSIVAIEKLTTVFVITTE